MREAAAQVGRDGAGVGRTHVLLRTGDALRSARAPLVDEHDVAELADLREDLVDGDGRIGRRTAGPALEVEERAARGLPRSRDDCDVQPGHARAPGLDPSAVGTPVEPAQPARRPPPAVAAAQ